MKGTLTKTAADEESKDAIDGLFKDDFEEQGEPILKFLQTKRERNDESLKEKVEKFEASLETFKSECHFDKEEDSYLASIRKGDLAKLEEHEQFLDVCQLAVKYYKELYLASKTDEAVEDTFVLTTLAAIKEEKRSALQSTSRFASAASQEMDG